MLVSKRHSKHPSRHAQSGVTLIEVLISMVVLAIGLLGFSSLMTTSMKSNRTAMHRSFATMYAYDIMDCMRANRTAARAGSYDQPLASSAPSSPSSVAGKDLKAWLDEIAATLPNGDGSIAVDNAGIATVQVQWSEGADTVTFTTRSSLRP